MLLSLLHLLLAVQCLAVLRVLLLVFLQAAHSLLVLLRSKQSTLIQSTQYVYSCSISFVLCLHVYDMRIQRVDLTDIVWIHFF
jgi:hypothetical protein